MKTQAFIIFFFIIASYAHAVPRFEEVKKAYKESDSVLLDRHGKVIHELRVDSKGRRLEWVGIKDISPALVKSVIRSEDKRFYEHHGVDWKAVGAAAIGNLFAQTPRGASTITMQLVAVIDKKLKPGKRKRTLTQKWKQIDAAKNLEETWTKEEIIEAYLNLVAFKGELQGITVASRGLFDKEPNGLDETESLILAALIRSPNASVENVSKRACVLGNAIKSQIRCEDIKILAKGKLIGTYSVRQKIALAPHVAKLLIKKDGIKIISTLDSDLQRFASEILQYQLTALKKQNVNDGAILVVENKTGDILAYVANSGLDSSARYVDGIRAKRQAGSTLKPFLYELVIERGLLTAASILNDSPLNISTPTGVYAPHDYDSDYKGAVSVRTALSGSLNIPAVRALMLIELDSFVNRLKQLGFEDLNDGDYYGPSLALGAADVSLYELVNAYKTFANNGKWGELRLGFGDKKKSQKQILKRESAFIISDILSDREARSVTFGFENPLATRFWTAVKTGTSKDMRDNWCVGFSEKYTVGVWVGNFSGEPMWNVSGITGAAPIWLETMNYLHRSSQGNPPQTPEGVITKRIAFQNKIEPERYEWFIQGTEPADTITGEIVFPSQASYKKPHIVYPIDGTIIALDPDIPEANNLIFFEAETSNKKLDWVLNNEKIGTTANFMGWTPRKGKYVLSLVDKQGNVFDSAEFEVRGSEVVRYLSEVEKEGKLIQ